MRARGCIKFLVVVFVALIAIVAVSILFVIKNGVSARGAPTRTEAMLAKTVRHLAIPYSARAMPNPLASTPDVLQEGREHFADHCALCHANDGSGRTEMGQNFYPKVPDMRGEGTQKLSDGEIFYIIRNGVRLSGMPAWAGEHDDADNWELVHFIRHLPKITPAELEEMKALNPLSRHERKEQQEEHDFLEGAHKNEGH